LLKYPYFQSDVWTQCNPCKITNDILHRNLYGTTNLSQKAKAIVIKEHGIGTQSSGAE
jgi:hypothetical protein